jgi:arginyl-tRNA synthetase
MINIFEELKAIFKQAIIDIAAKNSITIEELEIDKFTIEPTREKIHGDFACNAAMVMLRHFKETSLKNPKILAQEIINQISHKDIEKLEIAGSGFINISIKNEAFFKIIGSFLQQKEFIFQDIGKGEKVNLEYASPNPTGPIHVGHTRGAIYGDVLATLLKKTGFDVLKEYYINDAGAQIDKLLLSALFRYGEALGEINFVEISTENKSDTYVMEAGSISYATKGEFGKMITSFNEIYPGEYLKPIGEDLKQKYGALLHEKYEKNPNPEMLKEILSEIRDFVVDSMLNLIKKDLQELGIIHDSYFSEKKELHDTNKIDEAIEILRQKGLIYEGKIEAPKTAKGVGALPEGYSDEDQTLFKSTLFGDDVDRVVKKSDGTPTYLAGDMAYALSKFERGAKQFIMPLGFDHAGYVKRLDAVVQALSNKQAKLKVILCQMVKFIKNGEPLKMSKRAGNFITAREVIDEVGPDALRFIMLTRKNDAPFDFDLQKVIEQSKDNPIFYVQYAHARCCSVIRNLENQEIINEEIDFDALKKLQDESEIELIKKIIAFPRLIEMAVTSFEPHRIAFYLQEIAAIFHSLWNKGIENQNLKFIIKDDFQTTKARIYLIMATKLIIKTGLEIFNINAKEEMR